MATTAVEFIGQLWQQQSDETQRGYQRYFKSGEGEYGYGDNFIGVKMGDVFALSKASAEMPIDEIEKLLESDIHEARVGALRIMANLARARKTPVALREQLFDLYIRRHDRINNWDLVDLAAGHVIGSWLLDTLARSENMWERRTSVYALTPMIRNRDLDDLYAIADILLNDSEDLIQKSVGTWLREAGKYDKPRLEAYLGENAAIMPRTMLRTAIEKFPADERKYWLSARKTP